MGSLVELWTGDLVIKTRQNTLCVLSRFLYKNRDKYYIVKTTLLIIKIKANVYTLYIHCVKCVYSIRSYFCY